MKHHNYYIYILTNYNRTTLYIGVTNDLQVRLYQHKEDAEKKGASFTGKYKCIYLVYYEHYSSIEEAIYREKQLKKWSRVKKDRLITDFNAEWTFLNDQV